MAYFPDKQQVKSELREATCTTDLSCVHLTTANFFELNIGYYRENTPREYWECNAGAFARPVPMQTPVMGQAELKIKNYFVPYRILSPQWDNFINRSPHVPYNGNSPILVRRMPYTTSIELISFIADSNISTVTTGTDWDFKSDGGTAYKLTQFGRHCVKILNQLGYQIIMDSKATEELDMMPLLAFAKIYLDYYYSSQYAYLTQEAYEIEAILKKDDTTPYKLTASNLLSIFRLTAYVWYSPDYFVSQWDNPTAPSIVSTSLGNITITDITMNNPVGNSGGQVYESQINNTSSSNYNTGNTPRIIGTAGTTGTPSATTPVYNLTQYALDNLKKLTDYSRRLSISVRSIDRYLARFGVILTSEKMKRSQYNGEQVTQMNFGAIYSTAETSQAKLGDYAGQGNINSDGQEHTQFSFNELDEFGVIMSLFTITPKIGYYQGIDRQHLLSDVESYFNGQWDNVGTQATSSAELYISPDGTSNYGKQSQIDNVFGYLPRQAHYKVSKDRLTGDFVRKNIYAGADAWHMFRIIDENKFTNTGGGMVHSPFFCQTAFDHEQYSRIFNYTEQDDGDKFNIILKFNITARIHALPLYDSYDFEGEGKKIIMNGLGPRQN